MRRVISSICILFLALGWHQQPVNANPFLLAKTTFEFCMETYEDYQKIRAFLDGPPTDDDQLTANDVKIFDKLNSISEKLSNVQYSLLNKIADDKLNRITDLADKLYTEVRYVQSVFKKFAGYTDKHRNYTVARFYDGVTSNGLLDNAVRMMYNILISENFKMETLISVLAKENNAGLMCIRGQSMQQIIYDIFKVVLVTDVQSVIIKSFAYGKFEEWQNTTYDAEKADVINNFNDRLRQAYTGVQIALAKASRELYKCEPSTHKKRFTYWKLEEIFQAYIHYEGDLYGNCKWKCPDLNDRHPDCNTDFCKKKKPEKRCQGHMIDCQSLSEDMNVCNAPDDLYRKYFWLETGSGKVYGNKESCSTALEYRDSEILIKNGFMKCEHCLCTCVSEKIEADRYFSVLEVTSDTLLNKVVTGVRLVHENNIFSIKIKQGELKANGSIDLKTNSWKRINKKLRKLKLKSFATVDANQWVTFDGVDYVYSVHDKTRTVFLDDIEPKPESRDLDEVVTGLRFRQVGKNLKLEIQRTVFDYPTGKLKSRSTWYSNTSSRRKRQEFKFDQATHPVMVKANNDVSQSGTCVTFRITDMEKDLGQSTIPFIDLQPIETVRPLSGAGIFLRGGVNSGGFLALKVMEYDRSKHM